MESLRQSVEKSEPTRLVTQRGRMVTVELIMPVVLNRMPQWFEALLAPHMKRFADDSWCPDAWFALERLSLLACWRDRWGSNETQEWFVSLGPIPPEEQPVIAELAKRLKLDPAMFVDGTSLYRHVLAPKGTW